MKTSVVQLGAKRTRKKALCYLLSCLVAKQTPWELVVENMYLSSG